MNRTEDNIQIIVPSSPTMSRRGSLDLPGILPLLLVAATWEFLLKRVVGLASGSVRGEDLRAVLYTLASIGTFTENFALLLALALIVHSVLAMIRQPTFGPIPHRITICGFAFTLVVIGALGSVTTIGLDTALLAHAASVLLSALLILGLSWHTINRRLLIGCVLLLLPTLLRFYASCAISIPLIRTNSAMPLHAFRAGEVIAVIAALAMPFLVTGLSPRRFIRRPPYIAMGLAAMPTFALAVALTTHGEQVRELCLLSLGFELVIFPAQLFYPVAFFCFLLSVSLLVLPGLGPPRTLAEQRVGYGMALLFVAGLDVLQGTVISLDAEAGHVPELVRFLLEGHWNHLNPEHQAMVGPPLRDMYQLVILALGYGLIAHGAYGQARPDSTNRPTDPERQEGSR